MDKGYYRKQTDQTETKLKKVAIHNKNGQGLLRVTERKRTTKTASQSTIKMDKGYYCLANIYIFYLSHVAIHNKNGQGLLQIDSRLIDLVFPMSQSTIKMDKGYYLETSFLRCKRYKSQSTIKMDKGYYKQQCLQRQNAY